jgi:hypothetical protein
LEKAKEAHARLGYNFIINRVAAVKRDDGSDTIDIVVDLRQIGVAPFYYDLDLALDCDEISTPLALKGAELLIADMDTTTFTFERVPATALCLQSVSFHLQSSYAFPERPIKFAQGLDGKVALTIPMPDGSQPRTEDSAKWGGVAGFMIAKVNGRSYETVGQLENWDEVDLADYGDAQLTIQANITGASTATYRYDGQAHSVSHSSFSLSGDVMGYSRPISYLMTPGYKKVTVSAFNYEGQIIGYASVEFIIVNTSTRAPSPAPSPSPASSMDEADNGKDTITSDEPHGFNTPKTPTVLEMVNVKTSTKQQSQKKRALIGLWTILPMFFLALLIFLTRWFIHRSRCATRHDEVDKSNTVEDPPSTTTSSENDDQNDGGTISPPSVTWSIASSPIFTIEEEPAPPPDTTSFMTLV